MLNMNETDAETVIKIEDAIKQTREKEKEDTLAVVMSH